VSTFHDTARPHVEAVLEQGEELRGFVALAATDRRLIILPLNRRIEPGGKPISITPETLAGAKAEGAGGWGAEPTAAIMDRSAAELKIKTTDGEKLKLMMMRGEGPGPLAGLGGGEDQRQGLEAVAANLAKWL
jgi:hypothetical protein